MIKKLIHGMGVTAFCFQLFLLPVKAAAPSVSLAEDGNQVKAVLELTESAKSNDVVSLKLSFQVDKKPSTEEISFNFDSGINSEVKEYRYHKEDGILTIYISGTKTLLNNDTLPLGKIVLSDKVKQATVSVMEDSLVTVNRAFDLEEIGLSNSSPAKPGDSSNNNNNNNNNSNSDDDDDNNRRPTSSYTYSRPTAVISRTWSQSNGNWQYLKANGSYAKSEWLLIDNKWYYFGDDTNMVTEWKQISGKWYYMDSVNGDMKVGWYFWQNQWYYLNPNGDMASGWKNINGKWYFLENSGNMATGWKMVDGKWYFLDSNGDMVTGWKMIDSKWYYMTENGDCLLNGVTPDGYVVDENGALIQ